MAAYEMVIGLEVHVELATKTKLFCACSAAFGGAPNTHCCPVCTGMPGTLPVLNQRVVDFAIAAGLALGCETVSYTHLDVYKRQGRGCCGCRFQTCGCPARRG